MKVNKESLKKNKFIQSLKRFANNNIVAKIIIGMLLWFVVSIPMDLYFFTRFLIDPDGFWQEVILIITFFIGLGWLQGILLFFGIALTLLLIFEDL